MQYLFVLGKNPQISKLEIENYFQSKFEVIEDHNQFVILKFKTEISKNVIDNLGGTVRIANFFKNIKDFEINIFSSNELLHTKLNYHLNFLNLEDWEKDIFEIKVKDELKSSKIKAIKKGMRSEIPSPRQYSSWKLNQGFELWFFKDSNGEFKVFRSIYSTNSKIYSEKDNNRPSKVVSHGSSFRLAQIMVNILNLNVNQTLVDPFCGTGTFLIEGLEKNLNVVGIDNDPVLIESSNLNLSWATERFKFKNNYEVVLGDSQSTEFQADGCVFEPYMGPFLKKSPSETEVKKIINNLEELYFKVFKNLQKNLSAKAKVVYIEPNFKDNNDKVHFLNQSYYQNNGFKLKEFNDENLFKLNNQINYEAKDGSILKRRLTVLEKVN